MKDRKALKAIAFLGGGAHIIPTYRAQLKLLAKDYVVTLYSEFYISHDLFVKEYKIKSVSLFKWSNRVREIYFGLMVLFDLIVKRPDIIHTHSTFPSGLVGIIISKILRIPVVVSLDAAEFARLDSIGFGALLNKHRAKVNRLVLRHASGITCLTEDNKRFINQYFGFSKAIHVIPRGIDKEAFILSQKLLHDTIQFISIGYIHPVKDQETLLRCFSILCKTIPCHLTHIGEDYLDGKMERLCDKLGIRDQVTFKGFVKYEQIHKFLNTGDIMLHTSLYESQAMVVVEALATGVLVCGTHVGLMADLSDECCLTVPVGDFRGLASKVIQVLKEKDEMQRLRSNGRKWVEDHDLIWTVNKYKALYDEL